MKTNLFIILILCNICACPALGISRWFSASFTDLRFTLHRYSHCVGGIQPLNTSRMSDTDYLVDQIRTFLDQGDYDNEQLANVSSLMDTICRVGDQSYPISVHVNITNFSNDNPNGKEVRCRSIDDAMNSMYYVFKRAALNRSEPLDFSIIQFYPNRTDKTASYNLSDLINTSWIKSDAVLEHVCSITNATKEYVRSRASKSVAQSRGQVATGPVSQLMELVDRLLEPLLGLQKRLYWESTNRIESIQTRISSGIRTIGSGVGSLLSRRANSTGPVVLAPTNLNKSVVAPPSRLVNNTLDVGNKFNLTTTSPSPRPINPIEGALTSSTLLAGSTTSTTTSRPFVNSTVAV